MANVPVKKTPEQGQIERTTEAERFTPAVDIYETDSELVMQADMPGVTKDNVDVKVEENVLTLTGTVATPPKDAAPLYAEYRIGDYYRAFTLSQEIDVDKISAEMTDGVLTLRLPKTDRTKSRKIEVKGR